MKKGLLIKAEQTEKYIWFDFVAKVKKEGKTVWEVLSGLIKKYLKK